MVTLATNAITNRSQPTNLYDTICGKLTDFEHCNDKETTDADWLQEFYHLLIRIQNAFECGEITI